MANEVAIPPGWPRVAILGAHASTSVAQPQALCPLSPDLMTVAEKRVLVTGGTGFVGRAVADCLARRDDLTVRVATRRRDFELPGVERHFVASLAADTDWHDALAGVSIVIHAAARVHVMRDLAADQLADVRAVNVAGTLALARQAAEAGAQRFVFISSIKVNGEETSPGMPFTERDIPAPADSYGISKLEAEQGLREIAKATGMGITIVRPVLVYGPGVRANFLAMMRALHRGLPLPLGAIHNRRSLVAIDNLVDLVVRCTEHVAAAGQTFLVSDGEDLSTPELLHRTAAALGGRARLFPVPCTLIESVASLTSRGAAARRLCRSLQVDITKARDLLGWSPPVRVDDALARTARAFLRANHR